MNESVIVALLSLVGTLVGSFAGILTANKLTNYRIEQLEAKVEKHNKVIERVYKLEGRADLIEQEIAEDERRLDKLEKHHD
jgi:vacuolar-type H+-ATPase subunit I/STV1